MIDYSKLRLSLKRLDEQHESYRNLDPGLPELIRDGVRESVIQRFETCYDCLWKVLRRYLNEELGVADPPNSPKPIFRLAHENGMIPPSLERWLQYAEVRIGTSHDYDGEKAAVCVKLMPDFIGDAVDLYQRMTAETWK